MTLNINDKISEIFSDESISNKRLLFSPKKQVLSKFNKNLQDNNFTLLAKNEKSMEISKNKYLSTNKKKHTKKRDNLKNEENQKSNRKLHKINNNNSTFLKNSKNNNTTINVIKKKESEEKNKNNFDKKSRDTHEDEFSVYKNSSIRGSCKLHHNKNNGSLFCFKGAVRKNTKILRKSKNDLEQQNNNKIEEKKEEDENKISSGDEKNKKDKKKNNHSSKSKNKIKNKSFYSRARSSNIKVKNNTINKIRGSIIDINREIKDDANHLENNNLSHIQNSQKPKKKKKKIIIKTKSVKSIETKHKNVDVKNQILPIKKIAYTPQQRFKDKEKEINNCSSSEISSDSDINSYSKNNNNNEYKKKENKKENNKEKISDKDSAFQSSAFSESDDLYVDNKLISQNYRSSKNINYFFGISKINKINDKNNNVKNNKVKFTGKRMEMHDSKKENKEKRKESHENEKVKPFALDNESNSEIKLKKLSNKRKIGISSQFQISRKVNNLFFLPNQEKKDNFYINNNQNIINPDNYISMEYNNNNNINQDKKNNRNIEANSNNNMIINGSNNIFYSKKETKNDYIETENNNKIQDKVEEKNDTSNISKDNIVKGKKKPKKTFFFCCL